MNQPTNEDKRLEAMEYVLRKHKTALRALAQTDVPDPFDDLLRQAYQELERMEPKKETYLEYVQGEMAEGGKFDD